MKFGKIPVASIVLAVLCLTSLVLSRIYPGQYKFDSPFIEGAFAGAALVYLLYYLNTWISAWANNKKEEAKNDSSL